MRNRVVFQGPPGFARCLSSQWRERYQWFQIDAVSHILVPPKRGRHDQDVWVRGEKSVEMLGKCSQALRDKNSLAHSSS